MMMATVFLAGFETSLFLASHVSNTPLSCLSMDLRTSLDAAVTPFEVTSVGVAWASIGMPLRSQRIRGSGRPENEDTIKICTIEKSILLRAECAKKY